MERFVQRHHDVCLDIAPPLRTRFASTKAAAAESRLPASTAKERLEEVAESGPAELELNAAVSSAERIRTAALLLSSPPGWRLEAAARLVPVGAELIILLPLRWIAQDFVRFVDLLELLFGAFLILRDIGMVLPRELP